MFCFCAIPLQWLLSISYTIYNTIFHILVANISFSHICMNLYKCDFFKVLVYNCAMTISTVYIYVKKTWMETYKYIIQNDNTCLYMVLCFKKKD